MNRIKGAIRNLEPLVDQSINTKIHRGPGRPPDLELKLDFNFKSLVLVTMTEATVSQMV
jgi:hypothetical protein